MNNNFGSVPSQKYFRLPTLSSSNHLHSIFDVAIKIESKAERGKYLVQACKGQPALKERLEQLLSAYFEAGSFLESPPKHDGESVDISPAFDAKTSVPGKVGPYVLKEIVGEGGFGLVYLAEQEEPVRRQVAIKLIKAGMDTKEVLSRFNVERQALAMMDHPHIATILDAGQTGNGRPYFVMEVVDGVPITEYCDQNRLPTSVRLQLFVDVCNAVQHAHQKGVIHRDIKPNNILVTELAGESVPKVIDFGIAKALQQPLTGDSIHTSGGQLIGTPLYMSPEQATRKNIDVDVRMDVYSLGILLFELLTGNTPITRQCFAETEIDEVLRMIRENETPRPSRQLSEDSERAKDVALKRRTTPSRLERLIQGDLDHIVAKATNKDRNRRYESAVALGRDVKRYLSCEPIEARAPSAIYRIRKFVRKNRAATITTLMFAAVLIVATSVSSWLAYQAIQNQSVAENALEAEEQAKLQVERSLESSAKSLHAYRTMYEAFKSVLKSPKPGVHGRDYKVFDLLRHNVKPVLDEFNDDLPIKSEMLTVFGDTYQEHGAYSDATTLFEEALKLRSSLPGLDDSLVMDSKLSLAENYYNCGLYDQSLLHLKDVERQLGQGIEHPDQYVRMMINFALIDRARASFPQALDKLQKTLEYTTAQTDPSDRLRIDVLRKLGDAYDDVKDFPQAVKQKRQLISMVENRNDISEFERINFRMSLATSLAEAGKLEEARELMEQGISLMRKFVEPSHPDLGRAMSNQAIMSVQASSFDEAFRQFDQAIRIAGQGVAVGELSMMNGRFVEALRSFDRKGQTRDRYHRMMVAFVQPDEENDEYFIRMACLVGEYFSKTQQHEQAIKLMQEAMQRAERSIGFSNPDGGMCLYLMARVHDAAGHYEDATPIYSRALALFADADWDDHRLVAVTKFQRGRMYLIAREPEKAVQPLEESLQVFREGADSAESRHRQIETAILLAIAQWGSGATDDSMATIKEIPERHSFDRADKLGLLGRTGNQSLRYGVADGAVHFLKQQCELVGEHFPDSVQLYSCKVSLGMALAAQSSPEGVKQDQSDAEGWREAEQVLLEAYQGLKKLNPKRYRQIALDERMRAADELVRIYNVTSQPEQKKKWEMRLKSLQDQGQAIHRRSKGIR